MESPNSLSALVQSYYPTYSAKIWCFQALSQSHVVFDLQCSTQFNNIFNWICKYRSMARAFPFHAADSLYITMAHKTCIERTQIKRNSIEEFDVFPVRNAFCRREQKSLLSAEHHREYSVEWRKAALKLLPTIFSHQSVCHPFVAIARRHLSKLINVEKGKLIFNCVCMRHIARTWSRKQINRIQFGEVAPLPVLILAFGWCRCLRLASCASDGTATIQLYCVRVDASTVFFNYCVLNLPRRKFASWRKCLSGNFPFRKDLFGYMLQFLIEKCFPTTENLFFWRKCKY